MAIDGRTLETLVDCLEYPVPAGSDAPQEVKKGVEFARQALA